MAIWNRKADAAFAESQVKNEEYIEQNFSAEPDGVVDEDEKGIALHRGLKARHITMIGTDFHFVMLATT